MSAFDRGSGPGGGLSEISIKRALAAPAVLAVAMVAIAFALGRFTGVTGARVFMPYLGAWAALTLLAMLIWVFVQVAHLAPTRAERPLQIVLGRLRDRLDQGFLSGLIFPVFLGAYTWAKVSIPFAVGYEWERTWADADKLLLGGDAWRLAHALMPPALASAWTLFYAVGWGAVLMVGCTLVAVFASRRFAATFFTAMMLSWLVGGIIVAYAISAAGPIFAHLVDPELGVRFAPLRAELLRLLGEDDLVMLSQRYLAAGMNVKIALKGGGISAMPSMHIATATILAIAAWRTRWRAIALLFLTMTFFGSVYLGYHYAVDAPAAVLVALFCWHVARRIHQQRLAPGQADLGLAAIA